MATRHKENVSFYSDPARDRSDKREISLKYWHWYFVCKEPNPTGTAKWDKQEKTDVGLLEKSKKSACSR